MNDSRQCAALFISAPASNQGKTTVTAALARHYRNAGKHVRVFKTGPDFIDPMILERASGNPVYQLDLWMMGENTCRRLLYEAAERADVILVEGVMGLFDGQTSSADLAALFGIPVLAVIDSTGMAQSFGAIAHGLATYSNKITFAGVIANRVASASHAEMLRESVPANIVWFGAMMRDDTMTIPSRHLGLLQAVEIDDLEQRLNQAAAKLDENDDIVLSAVTFTSPETKQISQTLAGSRIAIACDLAFSFIYRANLDLLKALGAELIFFSPLSDTALPDADALYLPGGYPELYLVRLSSNESMAASIRTHHTAGKPIVAECGGMLYLLESLTDVDGNSASLLGLLPGHAKMQKRLANLGLHSAVLPEGELRGHTFHHSQMESIQTPITYTKPQRRSSRGEPVFRVGRLHASYLHMYFASDVIATTQLFSAG